MTACPANYGLNPGKRAGMCAGRAGYPAQVPAASNGSSG